MEKRKVQVVIIAKNQLLLLQVKNRGDTFWQNITGSVEDNEDFLIGALRETEEETGIKAPSLIDLGLVFSFTDRFQKVVREKCYLLYLPKIPDVVLSEEHQDFKWIELNKVKETDYKYPSNFEAFKKSIEMLERYKP